MQATATTVSTRVSIGRILALGAGALMAFVLGAALALAATGWFATGDRSAQVFDSTAALRAHVLREYAPPLLRRPAPWTTRSTSTSCAKTAQPPMRRPAPWAPRSTSTLCAKTGPGSPTGSSGRPAAPRGPGSVVVEKGDAVHVRRG